MTPGSLITGMKAKLKDIKLSPISIALTSSGNGVFVNSKSKNSWNWLTNDQIADMELRLRIDTPITAPALTPDAAVEAEFIFLAEAETSKSR